MAVDLAKPNQVRDEVLEMSVLSFCLWVHCNTALFRICCPGGSYFARPRFGQEILLPKVEGSELAERQFDVD